MQATIRGLGPRLKHIYDWAHNTGPYTDIWDLCCDHGRLGLQLHQSLLLARCNIHLVDCVPSIINKLKAQYQHVVDSRLNINCLDAGEIILPKTGRHLIIIAGVSGTTVATLMQKLTTKLQTNPPHSANFELEYILSPSLNTFELRRYLQNHHFELIAEQFVSEKSRHHEHMHLRYHGQAGNFTKISTAGSDLWQPLTKDKVNYLNTRLNHYKNCFELGGNIEALPAISAYKKLLN